MKKWLCYRHTIENRVVSRKHDHRIVMADSREVAIAKYRSEIYGSHGKPKPSVKCLQIHSEDQVADLFAVHDVPSDVQTIV